MNGVKKQYGFAGTLAFIIDSDSLPIEEVFRFRMEKVLSTGVKIRKTIEGIH